MAATRAGATSADTRRRAAVLATLSVAYVGYAVLTADRRLPTMCPFRIVTGHCCPLCGLSTAIGRALRGDLSGALRAQPLAFPVLIGGAAGWAACRSTGVSARIGRTTRREAWQLW